LADRTVTVRLRAATGEYVAAMGAAGKSTKELRQDLSRLDGASAQGGRSLSRLGGLAAGAAGGMAALAGTQVLQWGMGAVQSFAAVEDATAALATSFGAAGQEIIGWVDQYGDAFNISQQEGLAAAQALAVFGKQAGLTGQELTAFTTDLLARAADMASYFGGSVSDAIAAIGSGLRGEMEPLTRYGVSLNDAALKAKALELGLISTTTNALTPQQKTLAASALIMERTADAQGDVARTSDSMGNKIKDASQKWADLQAQAGEAAAVLAGPVLGGLSGLAAVAGSLASGFASLPGPIRNTALALGGLAVASRLGWLSGMSGAAGTAATAFRSLGTAWAYAGQSAGKAGGPTATFSARLGEMFKIMSGGQAAGTALKGALSGALGLIGGPWGIALAGATTAAALFMQAQSDARARVDELTASLDQQTGALTGDTIALAVENAFNAVSDDDRKLIDGMGIAWEDFATILGGTEDEAQAVIQRLTNLNQMESRGDQALEGLLDALYGQRVELGLSAEAWKQNTDEQRIAAGVARLLGIETDDVGAAAARGSGVLSGFGAAATSAFEAAGGAVAGLTDRVEGLAAEQAALAEVDAIKFEASIAGLPQLEQAQERLKRAQEALAATTPGTREHAAALVEVARQEAAVGAAADAMAADQAAAADDTRKAIKAMKKEIAGIEFERGLIGMSELDAANARLARLQGELRKLKPDTDEYNAKLIEIAQATSDAAQASYDLDQTLADLDAQIAGVRFERGLIGLGDVDAERKRLQYLRRELALLTPDSEAYKRKQLEIEQAINRVTEAEARQSEERAAERQRQAEENAADRQRQIDEATSLRDQLRELLPPGFAASLLESTPEQINDVLGGLVDGVRAALSGSVERDLVALISSTNEQLAGLATQRAAVVEQLAAAESSLTDLRNQREQMVSGLSQAAAGNIMQAGTSARGLARWMTRRLATIKEFAADITALQARGLPQWLLRQIVDAAISGDLDGAAAMAKGLLAMPDADFTQLVTVAGQVQTAAGQLGQTAGSIMFDEGIAIAQTLVDGLTAQKTQLEAQMTALGEALRKAIEDALTRTPITVDVNGRVTLVYPDGQEARPAPATGRAVGGTVARGRTYLVGEAGPELLTMPASGYVTRAGDVPRTIAAAAAAAQPSRGLSIGSITVQAPPGQRVDRFLPTTLREAAYLMSTS